MIYLLVAELRCLIQAAREFSIDFVYALSPGLDIAFASKDDNLSLKAKLDQVNLRKLTVSLSIVQLSRELPWHREKLPKILNDLVGESSVLPGS